MDARQKSERTLLLSLLLSMWAPLLGGIAVVQSRSSTQLADFIRRTIELIALFVSWFMYRYISRRELSPRQQEKYQRVAAICIAVALGCSAVAMLAVAWLRLNSTYLAGGKVYLGLFIAILGAITNGWFWQRYTVLNRKQDDKIIRAQRQLYRAKTFVDLVVTGALLSVAIFPMHTAKYLDLVGTFLVACYLLWNSIQAAYQAQTVPLPEQE